MFWQTFISVFSTVFLAELGDKTQLATMLFASKSDMNKWGIFLGSVTALALASGLGVLVGAYVERVISPKTLKWIAGAGFVVIGIWTMFSD
jgi:putative Ca2+/H+ antiporter (TMEM165/GDT1 family)